MFQLLAKATFLIFIWFKVIVHPKMKILSLITHLHVFPNPEDFCSSLEHKLGYVWWNPRAFWPCIDSNTAEMFLGPET